MDQSAPPSQSRDQRLSARGVTRRYGAMVSQHQVAAASFLRLSLGAAYTMYRRGLHEDFFAPGPSGWILLVRKGRVAPSFKLAPFLPFLRLSVSIKTAWEGHHSCPHTAQERLVTVHQVLRSFDYPKWPSDGRGIGGYVNLEKLTVVVAGFWWFRPQCTPGRSSWGCDRVSPMLLWSNRPTNCSIWARDGRGVTEYPFCA